MKTGSLRRVAVALSVVLVSTLGASPALAKSGDSSQKNGLARLASKKAAASGSHSAVSDANCPGSPVKEFGAGAVCADSGFRAKDIPAFTNWGGVGRYKGDDFLGPEFIAAFGAENVCASTAADNCVLSKSAADFYGTMRKYIASGRCEGIVMLAGLMSLGRVKPSLVSPGASVARAVRPTVSTVLRNINYWWSTQFDENVQAATADIRGKGIAEVIKLLGSNLRSGVYGTMGIYSGKSGHAILPIALLRDPAGPYVAVVYDSNSPGAFGRVTLDPVADRWTYPAPGLGGAAQGWSGKSGTIDLTPMSSRPTVAKCPSCDGKDASGVSVKNGPEHVYSGAEVLK